MYQIKLIKMLKGKDIIKRLELKYGDEKNLKKLLGKDSKNQQLCFDLEEWNVYKDALDEDVKKTKVLITEGYPIGKIELELLNSIKFHNPESIRDLARMVDKDIKTVQPKVNNLARDGFIELKKGSKNNKIPVFHYDSIEIAI